MKKIKIIPFLFASLLLVGCDKGDKTDVIPPNPNPPVQEKAFTLPSKLELVINESLDLKQYINSNVVEEISKVSFEISNEDKVERTGTVIKAIDATKDGPISLKIKYEDYEAVSELTVLTAKDKLVAKLNKSIELESNKINSLDFTYSDTVTESNNQHTIYNFYTNNNVSVEDTKKYYTYSLIDEDTMIKTSRNISSKSIDYSALTLIDGESVGTKMNKEEAKNRMILPYIQTKSVSNPLSIFGVAKWTYTNFFKSAEHFGDDNLQKNIEYSVENNTYNLVTYRFPYFGVTQGIRDELSLSFLESGELSKLSSTTSYYSEISDISQIPSETNGKEVKIEQVEAIATYNKKEDIPADFPNYKDAIYKDYTPYFYDSSDYLKHKEITEAKIGKKIMLSQKDSTPSKVSSNLDKVEIVKVEGEGAATIGTNKNALTLTKAGNIVVTTTTTLSKITKTVNFNILSNDSITLDVQVTSSKNYLPSHLITNNEYPLNVYYDGDTSSKPVITPSVVGENTANVTFVKVQDNKYKVKATKAGTVTIKVVDSVLGEEKKIEKQLTFFEDTDSGIASYLTSVSLYNSNDLYSLEFTLDPSSATEGSVTLSENGENHEDTKVKGTFVVSNKKLSIKSLEEGEITGSSITELGFYSTFYSTFYNILKIKVVNLGSDTLEVYFYVK